MGLTHKFYIRKEKYEGETLYYLTLRVTINRKHIYKSIAKGISPDEYDPKLELFKSSTPQAVNANIQIQRYKDLLRELYLNSYYSGEVLTLKKVKDFLFGNNKVYKDFFEYCYNLQSLCLF